MKRLIKGNRLPKMKRVIIFVYIIANLLFVETSNTQFVRFERNPELNNRTCSVDEILFSEEMESKFQCASTCIEHSTCYTLFYTENTGLCKGCNTVYSNTNSLISVDGNIHYQIYPSCKMGWTGYMRSCYKLSSPQWFFVGAAECEADGGHAVYIETSVENEFLKQLVKTDSSTWAWYIGITECAEQGVWRYYGTEALVQFTDFQILYTQSSCCALFFDNYDYRWAQFECEHPTYPFPTICEINTL